MMNIHCGEQPVQLPQEAFHKLDYQVMGLAFNLNNEMGNLWDEKDYQHELALRCKSQGLDVTEEVAISIRHNGFAKTYFIDLLVNGCVFELKTTSAITEKHQAQILNYLFLTGTQHGKIINFRPDSLAWHFVSTSLCHKDRLVFSIETSNWHPSTEQGQTIVEIVNSLLINWGAYLSTDLYKEALCHFFNIPLTDGHQRFISLPFNAILHISSLCKNRNNLLRNLQKYLDHSGYTELFWVNFNQNKVEFSCLNNSA